MVTRDSWLLTIYSLFPNYTLSKDEGKDRQGGFPLFGSSPIWSPGRDKSAVILTVHYDGEQAVEERLETLVSTGDDFVEDLNVTK